MWRIEAYWVNAIARFLRVMFLQHLARYSVRPWHNRASAIDAAVMLTAVWLAAVVVLALTVLLAAAASLLPESLNPLSGPRWLYAALTLPVFLLCDRYVQKIADSIGETLVPETLEPFNCRSHRVTRWLLALMIAPILFATIGIWIWATH